MRAGVLGLGHGLPPGEAVAGETRSIARAPGGPSDLVLDPSRTALAEAGLGAADIELIVFATQTPDVTFPGAACFLQRKLEGCGTVGAMDIRAQCTGFLAGLWLANAFVRSGRYRRILLAAAEVHSSGLDYSERGLRVAALYGDGAAAALLGPADRGGVEAVVCGADGRYYDRFWCEFPASRHHPVRITVEAVRAGRHFPEIDFDAVAAFGRERLPAVITEALGRAGRRPEDVDRYFLSHILPEVADEAASRLGLPADRVVNAGRAHGHLGAATLPVALDQARRAGRIGAGARVCLAACGAGFTWGAAVMEL